LRLSDSVVGPVTIAQGGTATAPVVEAFGVTGERNFNNETSELRLSVSSTASWVSPALGSPRSCSSREGRCIPIEFRLATQSLQPGPYSATVTVSDPNAIDAPQQILVLVVVGSTIPDRVNLYVPPNGSTDSFTFSTNSAVSANAATTSGGQWLTVNFRGQGTFDFVRPYEVLARHQSGQAEGTYQGAVNVANSRLPQDNKTLNVTLNVTGRPIATPSEPSLRFRVHANSTKASRSILIRNRGLTQLDLGEITSATATGGEWLSAALVEGTRFVTVNADAKGIQPGIYRGTVTIKSNAANSPAEIPVVLEVVAQGPPVIRFNGLVDSATLQEGDVLAPGGAVTGFGEAFSYSEPSVVKEGAWPNTLGGTSVFVDGRPAPLSFSSYEQVNFQIPFDVDPGERLVRVDRGGQLSSPASIIVRSSVPKMIRLALRALGVEIPEIRDYYGIAFHGDGTQSLPPEFGLPNSRPTRRGETITMLAMGLGRTDPPVAAGTPGTADPLIPVASASKQVCFGCLVLGGQRTEPSFVGLAPGLVGIYHVVVTVPENVPSGDVPVRVELDSASSEYGLIAVE
jgi:uncharacterized protein (TIGR03437 family)